MLGLEISHYVQLFTGGLAFIGAMGVYLMTSRRQIVAQRAETYLKLETESARLFEIARQNREMMTYLNGEYDPADEAERNHLDYHLQWYLPQVLNLFEVSISFRNKNVFENEVFVTWIAWYLEVSSSRRFAPIWAGLRTHYKPGLRQFMDLGIQARKRSEAIVGDEFEVTKWYFDGAAKIMGDQSIPRYFRECLSGGFVEEGKPNLQDRVQVTPPKQ